MLQRVAQAAESASMRVCLSGEDQGSRRENALGRSDPTEEFDDVAF